MPIYISITILPPRACSQTSVVEVRAAPRRRVRSEQHIRNSLDLRTRSQASCRARSRLHKQISSESRREVRASALVGSRTEIALPEGIAGVDVNEAVRVRPDRGRDYGANDLEYVLAATVALAIALKNGEESDVTAIEPARRRT
jgi:hypothetical protein